MLVLFLPYTLYSYLCKYICHFLKEIQRNEALLKTFAWYLFLSLLAPIVGM